MQVGYYLLTRPTGQEMTAIEKTVGYTHIFQEMGPQHPMAAGPGVGGGRWGVRASQESMETDQL